MNRIIEFHNVPGNSAQCPVRATDERGEGNANHEYAIDINDELSMVVTFQNGPVREHGQNGITNEALLAIVIDRLDGFQAGEFSCRENAIAKTKLEEALHWLQQRTMDRLRRGVEGTNEQ